MKFIEAIKKLKPTSWHHWVGYFTIGTVISSGITVITIFETKKSKEDNSSNQSDSKPKNSEENKNIKTDSEENKNIKKKGSQADLPEESNLSIDLNSLVTKLISEGDNLNVAKVADILKNVGINVDIEKGTSYGGKKHNRPKLIGNKYGDIDRFIMAWSKLEKNEKQSLKTNRHKFAYLFGNKPEKKYRIGNQVEYILLNPKSK